jgi:hypothetical protein
MTELVVRRATSVAKRKDNRLVLEDVTILFPNFAGEKRKFNDAGKRNFCIALPEDLAEEMAADGWKIKRLQPRDEDEIGTAFLKINVNYHGRVKPKASVVTMSKGIRTPLEEEDIELFDWAEFSTVDIIINPYDWDNSGVPTRTAYLANIVGIFAEDTLEQKYGHYRVVGELEVPELEGDGGFEVLDEGTWEQE